MLTSRLLLAFLSLCTLHALHAQTNTTPAPKSLGARRFTGTIQLDGNINDTAWKEASIATDFIELRPTPFKPEEDANRTIIKMMYNDEGLYLGGYCYEKTKDSIAMELAGRDGFGNNDFIGFIFDTYKDKLNGFEYFVTPLGEQFDAKQAPNPNGNSEDFSWNAVWRSAAQIHQDGWSFEMFLPFSAIRFSKKNIQDWGLNIVRKRQKTGQQLFWNSINPNVNGFLTQEGFWTGLENIKPPVRLQFTPYFSTYANHYPQIGTEYKSWTSSVTGGMDVKYGISQALTLDMTLIPDFGQVQSDNQVLNLSPFEVKFNENRNFFTEGTELFNKGNLFYSRRIGSTPLHYYDVDAGPNGHVIKNPSATRLINGTKVSGRLQGGLGVGFFNALVAPQYAVVEDAGKQQHEVQTNPLTNYNIMVLNQSLKHNSSISLVNTNVWRSGHDYDANVTAALFDLYDKKNTWNLGGKVGTSNLTGYLPGGKTKTGYTHSLYFGKVSGRFNFNLSQDLTDANYDINDIGYISINNFLDHSLYMGYNWTKPSKWYNNLHLNFNAYYSRRLKPTSYQNASLSTNINGQLKNLWYAGLNIGYETRPNDFYEPRVAGRVFKGWASQYADVWVQTNSAKKYSAYVEIFYVNRQMLNGKRTDITVQQQYRFNNKFTLGYNLFLSPQPNNVGFADIDTTSAHNVIFGLRNRSTVENILTLKYNFSQKVYFTARARHYWSRADYTKFFTLLQNGELGSNDTYSGNRNQNSNYFNVDALFTWQFGPGSFVNIGWKNAIQDFNRDVTENYSRNFRSTFRLPQNNNFSLKVIYFLDYLQLKNHKAIKLVPKADNVM